MFCAPNVRRTEKRRKNCCSGLENRGRGRPREARANKFGRQNGQVGQKSALEVPPGPPKIYKWARTKQLRARKRDQSPRGASGRLGLRTLFSESSNGLLIISFARLLSFCLFLCLPLNLLNVCIQCFWWWPSIFSLLVGGAYPERLEFPSKIQIFTEIVISR